MGKRITGIRVTKLNGNEISIGSSFIRHLFDMIDISFGVGILVIYCSDKKQRIGDQIAKTVVLEEPSVRCENCNVELELSTREKRMGEFKCPKCGYETKLNTFSDQATIKPITTI